MANRVPRDLRGVVKAAEAQGWVLDFTKRGHLRLSPPRGKADAQGNLLSPVVFAGTSSDWRGNRNGIAALRRAGVKV